MEFGIPILQHSITPMGKRRAKVIRIVRIPAFDFKQTYLDVHHYNSLGFEVIVERFRAVLAADAA
jgi:hypothetical protein